VEDVLDIANDAERGLFIVIGNVRCRNFIRCYDTCSIVDGDLDPSPTANVRTAR